MLEGEETGQSRAAKEGRKLKGDTASEDKNREDKERQVAYGGCHELIHFKALYVLIFFSPWKGIGLTSVSVADITFTFLSESYLGSPVWIWLVHLAWFSTWVSFSEILPILALCADAFQMNGALGH